MTPEHILAFSMAFFLAAVPLALVGINSLVWWFRAKRGGAGISFMGIVAMHFRKVPPMVVVQSRLRLVVMGYDIPTELLEAHYLKGGDLPGTVDTLLEAKARGLELDFTQVAKQEREAGSAEDSSHSDFAVSCPALSPVNRSRDR